MQRTAGWTTTLLNFGRPGAGPWPIGRCPVEARPSSDAAQSCVCPAKLDSVAPHGDDLQPVGKCPQTVGVTIPEPDRRLGELCIDQELRQSPQDPERVVSPNRQTRPRSMGQGKLSWNLIEPLKARVDREWNDHTRPPNADNGPLQSATQSTDSPGEELEVPVSCVELGRRWCSFETMVQLEFPLSCTRVKMWANTGSTLGGGLGPVTLTGNQPPSPRTRPPPVRRPHECTTSAER